MLGLQGAVDKHNGLEKKAGFTGRSAGKWKGVNAIRPPIAAADARPLEEKLGGKLRRAGASPADNQLQAPGQQQKKTMNNIEEAPHVGLIITLRSPAHKSRHRPNTTTTAAPVGKSR